MGRRTSQGEIKAARVSSLIDRSVPDVWPGLSLLELGTLWGKWTSVSIPLIRAAEAVMKDVGSVLLNARSVPWKNRWATFSRQRMETRRSGKDSITCR